MRGKKIKSLEELRKALVGVPERRYHIGGFADSEICLEEFNGRWEVYFAELGNKEDRNIYDNCSDACEDMYERLTCARA